MAESKDAGKGKAVKPAMDPKLMGIGVIAILFVVAVAYLTLFPSQQSTGGGTATIKGKGATGAPAGTAQPVEVTSAQQANETLTDVSQKSAGISTNIDGILEDLST